MAGIFPVVQRLNMRHGCGYNCSQNGFTLQVFRSTFNVSKDNVEK
jgi:hypothetical protein